MLSVSWEEYSWVEIESALKGLSAVILPVGSIEQHGPHLPLKTDSFVAYKVSLDAALKFDGKVLVLPPLFYGVSEHHMDFLGTITISEDTLIRLVVEIASSLKRHGVRKVIIINGHGGNIPALEIALRQLAKLGLEAILIDPWELISDVISSTIESDVWGHACEFETSVVLAIDESLVRKEKIPKNKIIDQGKYFNLWNKNRVRWAWRTKNFSEFGIIGYPDKASKDKGEKLYREMLRRVIEVIEEFIKK